MISLSQGMQWLGRSALDFALPARCAGCGTITDAPHQFCGTCWQQVEWLGQGGCEQCGLPLEATDADCCARCLARPPIIARSRAAIAYGDIARSLVLRLKYSRKVALAATMARYMRPLIDVAPGTVLGAGAFALEPAVVARFQSVRPACGQSQSIVGVRTSSDAVAAGATYSSS